MLLRSCIGYFFLLVFYACNERELMIGDFAPPFDSMVWLQSTSIEIKQQKDKVLLLRWWTDGCIFCMQSAEALNAWHQQYKDSGLVVIGLYHPKPQARACDAEEVREYVVEKAFQFPIAIDDQWNNLHTYWLQHQAKKFTSVSFLIGKDHRIRYIHPGGEYHAVLEAGHEQCVQDYHAIQRKIVECLRERID